MASDRGRVTYDERRQYRAVVAQQGRVTLEADVNEAWMIVAILTGCALLSVPFARRPAST